MNAELEAQDPEVSHSPFARLSAAESDINQRHIEGYNEDYTRNDPYAYTRERFNCSTDVSPINVATIPGRNKRKNFNPRYTSTSPMGRSADEDNDGSPNVIAAPSDDPESRREQHQHTNENENISRSSQSSASPIDRRPFSASSGAIDTRGEGQSTLQHSELPPWMQMIHHYNKLIRASEMAQYHVPSSIDLHGGSAYTDMAEWVRKFGGSESAVSAIRDLLRAYQGSGGLDAVQGDNGSVNPSTEPEPPTPPITPHACNSSRSNIPNGSSDLHETPPAYQSPLRNSLIKEEVLHPPAAPSLEDTNYPKTHSTDKQPLPVMPQPDYQWGGDMEFLSPQFRAKTELSAGEEDTYVSKTPKAEAGQFNSYHDDSSDYGDRQQSSEGRRQRCRNFQKTPDSFDRRMKSECDDTDTTVGDADNNPFDEDDYPPSPNDFPDSGNDEEDDDDSYSVSLFCDDEQSVTEEQVRTSCGSESERNTCEGADADENRHLEPQKEGSCSNSFSKISVRNLGSFYEQSQLNAVESKLRRDINEKGPHSDFARSMRKFTSYVECQNEMCRLENLREHYHCYDFPCFGKILTKKEEVIRHVKWHRKRMESLNHGFMRFSSSDDCSTAFGANCQHNRKQTHYHCFQPNCDRVYISTSDVQMHSNFHRKDSAIHKEGFQRFRANEKCSADYCMFADQKTTHFHCRRNNCRYTFKNKADMEKHKTYHIKDLKLARDGFKKFLKNEACPYKHCRFSKVCNHIHCARENCFYVLHSSGQLLSHKRKHERMDNEQTYCRYKMLAVKAALLGKAAASAAGGSVISPFNLTNSLLQIKKLEINPFMERAASEPSLPSPKKELYYKDCATESPPSSSLSVEFFQQMKKRHEEILKQNHAAAADQPVTAIGSPEISVLPVIQHTSSPQHQYSNLATDCSQLTPSVIQQFFTTECPTQKSDNDEPMNLKNHALSDETVKKVQCVWSERLEPHLHCILKDCNAVIPENMVDISSHIRMHRCNRDAYGTAATAPEPYLNTGAGTSNNPMQITTIDGFFNRKRGRPPKNRFVEVYKNAQQSPQAIFTSFKLEKQTMSKDCSPPCDSTSSPSYIQPPSYNIEMQQKGQSADENRSINPSSPQSLRQTTSLEQTPLASQFTTYKVNEHCGVPGGRCSLALQHHYHCACSPDCTFITVERDLLSVHLERQHTIPSFADTISTKFKRFDRNIGLDCGISECRLRKTRPHLHCRQCYRQISPFDLETHICGSLEQGSSTSSSPTKKLSSFYSPDYSRSQQQLQPELMAEGFTIHSAKGLIKDFTHLPSVTFSTLNELRKKVSEMEPETRTLPKRSHEDEKVLVVRAAGTYFPENTNELSGTSSQVQQKMPASSTASEGMQGPTTPVTSSYCSTPYCKMKRKPHEHCEYCDQFFLDASKSKAHRLRHIATTNKPYVNHLIPHSTEAGEENHLQASLSETGPIHVAPTYEDQPQDLSVSPSATTPNQDDKANLKRETYTAAPATSPLPLAPGTLPNLFPPDLMCSISMQNFQLAQLASLYQHNPYYYQHFYPFLRNAATFTRHQQHRQAHPYRVPCNEDKPYLPASTECPNPPLPNIIPPVPTVGISVPNVSRQFPFLSPLLMTQTAETLSPKQPLLPIGPPAGISIPSDNTAPSLKRKLANGSDDLNAFIDALSPSTKKQMQFAAGLAAAAAAATTTTNSTALKGARSGCAGGSREQHGQHFKIKDEQIPTGYLKYRFNEDCYFPKCGYRNHQSHFHCDRNDCHYSFCDKTRFVQHTARHERLDKLMGNDFRQYRANMNCGYQNCPYFKNLGSANKSSHFHCLKCDFICSDTNKVVAHRRQHSKMEYIRMAGFRKVTNSEKCNSTFEATVPTNGNEVPGTVECSYSQKQTHYHCLVCDVSVLSRAQLASHKHKA